MIEYNIARGFRETILEGAEVATGILDTIDVEKLTSKFSKLRHIMQHSKPMK